MNASQRVSAMHAGEPMADGYDKPLTQNAAGEWVNEYGDTPCPRDGEMTNVRCWKCGWERPKYQTRLVRRSDDGKIHAKPHWQDVPGEIIQIRRRKAGPWEEVK